MDSKDSMCTARPEISSTGFQILSMKLFPQLSLWELNMHIDAEHVLVGEVG